MIEKKQTSKVLTQNDIYSIVESQISSVSNIIDVVVKAATNNVVINSSTALKQIENYSSIVNTLFGKDGVVMNIIGVNEKLQKLNVDKLKTENINKAFNSIYATQYHIVKFVKGIKDIENVPEINFNGIADILKNIDAITSSANKKEKSIVPLWFRFKLLKHDIKKTIQFIESIVKINYDDNKIQDVKSLLLSIKTTYNDITNIFNSFDNIDVKASIKYIIRMQFINAAVNSIVNLSEKLAKLNKYTKSFKTSESNIDKINDLTSSINALFENVEHIKVNLLTLIKLKLTNIAVNNLNNVISNTNIISKRITTKTLDNAGNLIKLINSVKMLFDAIKNTSVGLFTWLKIKLINAALLGLDNTLSIISKIKVSKRIEYKINLIKSIVGSIASIFTTILLMTPVWIVGSVALLFLTASVFALKLAMRFISKNLMQVSIRASFSLLIVGVITLAITGIAAMFLIMAIIAIPVVKASLWIIGLIGVIFIISTLVIGLGALAALAAPVLIPALTGMFLIGTAVGIITGIGVMLLFLQTLQLDAQLIKSNVSAVLNTARYIINMIFEPYDKKKDDTDRSWISKLISRIGGGLFDIISTISSIGILIFTIAAVACINMIAVQLRILQSLKLNSTKIFNNVETVLSTARSVASMIFDNKYETAENPEKRSWIKTAISNLFNGRSNIIGTLLSIKCLAISICAISLITFLVAQLRIIQAFKLKPDEVTNKVALVIDSCKYVVDAIFNRKETIKESPSNKSWIGNLLRHIGSNLMSMLDVIMSISWLATSIGAISLVNMLARHRHKLFTIEIASDIQSKVNNIIFACQSVTDAIFNRPDTMPEGQENPKKKGLLRGLLSGIGDGIEFIASMGWLSTALISVGMVGKLAEHLKSINSLPDLSGIDTKTVAICTAADKVIDNIVAPSNKNITDTSRLSVLERVNTALAGFNSISTEQIDNNTKAVDNYIRFVDKVNTVDVAKLETSAKMFEQMANFSNSIKGNFEKLAESLSEDLMPILEELKEIMEKVPEKLDTGFQNTSASIAATTVAPTTSNVTAQVRRENPNMTAEEVSKIVDSRMKEHANTTANSTVAKIDELLSLLKGFSGEHVVVQTI